MAFNTAWDDLHAKREWGVYPNEHLVRFVKRVFPEREWHKAIDLGCGAGAQSNMLIKEGFIVYAVEGSPSAASKLAADWSTTDCAVVYNADIVEWKPPIETASIDLVVDVCTLQHLQFDDAKTVIAHAHSWLKSGGWFFSLMASHEFDLKYDIPPRLIPFVDLCELFGTFGAQWKMSVGHENVLRPHDGTVAHWIIEAQKN